MLGRASDPRHSPTRSSVSHRAAFTGIFAPYRTDIWVPMRTRPRLAAMLDDRSRRPVMVFGRLGADATPGQASAELNGIEAQLVAEHGASTEPLPPIVAEPVRGIPILAAGASSA